METTTKRGEGWIIFSGIMLILGGINIFLNGLWALNANQSIENNFKDTVLFSDTNLDVWGWIYVIAGLVILVAGFAVFGRAQWARWIGVCAASIGAIVAFFWLFTPYWPAAMISVAINVLVIYGLGTYGERELA